MGHKEIRSRIFKMHKLMAKRFGPKFWKSGRRKGQLRDPGRELPFNREQLLDWMIRTVGYGAKQCPYCHAPIDALSAGIDHDRPTSRGGDLGLGNLTVCCQTCNRAKGGLTSDEFKRLSLLLDDFEPAARQDIVSRLKTGSMGIRLRSEKKVSLPAHP